jgi:hypothetical protein
MVPVMAASAEQPGLYYYWLPAAQVLISRSVS